MRSLTALLRSELVVLLRDKGTLFFTFLFPLIFILIFGAVMGGDGDAAKTSLGVYTVEGADQGALEEVIAAIGSLTYTAYDSRVALESALANRDLDFGLVWDGEQLLFLYDPARIRENHRFEAMARGITAAFNLRVQGLSPVLTAERVHLGREAAADWLTNMVPGIIAFSILSAGLFAVSGHISAMKKRRILERMLVTPMRPLALLGAIISVRLVIVYISTLITLFVATALFDLHFAMDWVSYTLLVVAATLGMMGLGTVIALVVRRPESAGNVANIIAMVMMFLSGIFFPVELMPGFLRAFAMVLPLTYIAEAMRYVTGVAYMTSFRFTIIVFALLGLAIVLLPFLARYVVRAERR